ncbi:hypothetical protein SAMN00808754_1772 [Thermanaeromonas toyohensis ToBE]|uniref:Uncharacterized protein n=1 Tax=Thermanaeromonas toyohensis ToBE TaxID=698762 RepID=A0A1W1VUX3_9FIRM|nr:hypothetical protein [Thermanaeromonas toyohensis]SMB97159.1 hypothetical protein SAMN00808754_1772 [Thermanaeromonas toyohensis ToBE]
MNCSGSGYIKKEGKDHVVYVRNYGEITVENKFPRNAPDAEERLEAFRRLAAQMLWEQTGGTSDARSSSLPGEHQETGESRRG